MKSSLNYTALTVKVITEEEWVDCLPAWTRAKTGFQGMKREEKQKKNVSLVTKTTGNNTILLAVKDIKWSDGAV